MQPTINMNVTDSNASGDRIFINPHNLGDVNDIVVAKVSWYENYIIKRMVGTPGDKIEIKESDTYFTLYVNDEPLYSKEKTGENTPFSKTGSIGYFANYNSFLTNPEFADYVESDGISTYIRLGDDDYFLMGDNWGHTYDSIAQGPVKASEIIGKVDLIIDVTNNNPFTPFNFFMKKIFSF